MFASLITGVKRRIEWLKILLFNREYSYLPEKQRSELLFWFKITRKFIEWYKGEIPHLYGHPPPKEKSKVRGYSLKENAIRTWARFNAKRYLD